MEEEKKEVKQESSEDKELNDLILIEPIKNFLKKLKEKNFQELVKCKEWRNLKLDKRTEDKYSQKSYEYYIVKLGRVIANYINQHYEKDSNSYYFTFPVDNTSILVEHNHHDQLRDVVMRRFRGYRTNRDSEDLVKLISYSFYGWCKENKLIETLKISFQLTKEENSEADIIKALYDFFTGKRQYHSNDLITDKKISADYILFGKIPSCSKDEEFKQFINKIIGTRSRKNWDIYSSALEEIDYSKKESKEKAASKIKKIGERILEEARKYPSYDYLYQGEHYSDLAELLRICTSYKDSEDKDSKDKDSEDKDSEDKDSEDKNSEDKDSYTITIKLPIGRIVDKINEWFHKKSREYTYFTLLEVSGAFADTAANSENHVIDLETVIHRFAGVYEEKLINDIYNDLKSENPNWIVGNKFAIKQYRLIFESQARGILYSRNHTAPEQIIKDVYYKFQKIIDFPVEENHTVWQFDNLIYFSFSLLKKLDYSISIPLIELLCKYANDFTVENRMWQECSISILTYILLEKYDLSQYLREKVFLCFGKSIYKTQNDNWKSIQETSVFYKKFARDFFIEACDLVDNGNHAYAKRNPIFFFWYGYVSEEPNVKNLNDADYILYKSAYIQKESWFGNTVKFSSLVDTLKDLLDKVYDYLIKDSQKKIIKDKNVLKLIYSSNYLCFAIHNLQQKKVNLSLPTVEKLVELAVYTDFYTRYYNAAYNLSEYFEKFPDVYLVNGSFRLISSMTFSDIKIELDKEKRKIYERWFGYEKGRYKILLTRLLDHTNFFDELSEDTRNHFSKDIRDTLETTKFLSYDNISEDVKNKMLSLHSTIQNEPESCC